MKIPFDIKYRPQIESGEYKVETRDGRRVKIIYWDLNCTSPIVAVMDVHIDLPGEIVDTFSVSGMAFDDSESPSDLFIITPEPELSEFEKKLSDIVGYAISFSVAEPQKPASEFVKEYAAELLELAKNEIYSHESLVEYAKTAREEGKAEAMWRKAKENIELGSDDFCFALDNDGKMAPYWATEVEKGQYYITESDIENLPKED